MVNPFKEVNWNPDMEGMRRFATSLVVGFPIMAVVWLLIGRAMNGSWSIEPMLWLGLGGAALGTLLWIIPVIAKPFYIAWYGVACSIGLIISNLLLIGFYLVVVTLFGLVRRTFPRQAVRKGFTKDTVSYWLDAERVSDPKRYYSQF